MKPMPVEEHPKCNFTSCAAGLGLAGQGVCFLRGEWGNPECPRFVDEKKWVKERERENAP